MKFASLVMVLTVIVPLGFANQTKPLEKQLEKIQATLEDDGTYKAIDGAGREASTTTIVPTINSKSISWSVEIHIQGMQIATRFRNTIDWTNVKSIKVQKTDGGNDCEVELTTIKPVSQKFMAYDTSGTVPDRKEISEAVRNVKFDFLKRSAANSFKDQLLDLFVRLKVKISK